MKFSRFLLAVIAVALIFQSSYSQEVALGEAFIVGTTFWDIQQNSTVGKTISRDDQRGVHFVWTKSFDAQNANRQVYYNFFDENIRMTIQDQLDRNEVRIDNDERSGYVSLVTHVFGEELLAVPFYHLSGPAAFAIDWERGGGAFSPFHFSQGGMDLIISAKGAVDRNDRMHVIGSIFNPMAAATFELNLWNAEMDDGDISDWNIDNPIPIEITSGLGHHIVAATETDQVAIAWFHSIPGNPPPREWEGTTAYSMNNDLYVYESPDGDDWNFEDIINVTRTIESDSDLDEPYSYGDTLRPYNDLDMLYVGDVLHILFSTRGYWADPLQEVEPPVERLTEDKSFIWHWDSESDTLTLVADGWYDNDGTPESQHNNVARPSIGIDADGKMYCLFRQVTDDDMAGGGYCYGELMLTMSSDDGITWSEAINLTETTTEGESEYVNELHPSLAELVDDDLHIYYQLSAEGFDGQEKMIYQRIPVADLPEVDDLVLLRNGFQYHMVNPASVGNDIVQLPQSLEMSAYPNPFNSTTTIGYSLHKSGDVGLILSDISGRLIHSQMFSNQSIGEHSVAVDASDLPTGIYFARLEANGMSDMKKLVLVK